MSDADVLGILTMVLCLAGSVFFSGSETALTSLGPHQARKIHEEGGRRGRTVATWVEDPVRVLSTILVGNNVTNTLMGSVATALAIRHLAGGEWGDWAVPVAVFFTTTVLLIFGEILPKAAGRIYAHRVALPVLTVLNVLNRVLGPITWFLSRITELMLRRAQGEDAAQKVTADELDYLVKVGQREGSIPADQAALLRGIFRFEDKIVRDIMVPENRVTAIDLDWSADRVIDRAHASGHSRMPVYRGDLDHIVGVLHIKQIVGLRGEQVDLERVMRPPMFVSESLLIQDLLQRFREQRVHLAIVVDDGGHTVGVVTLEDVLEQIVGQIFDETDRAPTGAIELAGLLYVDGQAPLTRVEERLGVDLEVEELEGVDSVGDLLTQLAGQMPTTGSVFVYEGVRFKVLAANDRRVIRVSVEQVEVEDADED